MADARVIIESLKSGCCLRCLIEAMVRGDEETVSSIIDEMSINTITLKEVKKDFRIVENSFSDWIIEYFISKGRYVHTLIQIRDLECRGYYLT